VVKRKLYDADRTTTGKNINKNKPTYTQNNYEYPCASSCAPPPPTTRPWASSPKRLLRGRPELRKVRVQLFNTMISSERAPPAATFRKQYMISSFLATSGVSSVRQRNKMSERKAPSVAFERIDGFKNLRTKLCPAGLVRF